ncbi:MAG: sigma-70 family RNA polymerase sigma factor [archaeon]|nr:sigma-70 family RNA polymerase sigma factor [archaeon]
MKTKSPEGIVAERSNLLYLNKIIYYMAVGLARRKRDLRVSIQRTKPTIIPSELRLKVRAYSKFSTEDPQRNAERNGIFDELFKIRGEIESEEARRNVDELIAELSQPIIRSTARIFWKKRVDGQIGRTLPTALSADDLIGNGNLALIKNYIPAYKRDRKNKGAFHTFLFACLNREFARIFDRKYRDVRSYHGFENPDNFLRTIGSRKPVIGALESALGDFRSLSRLERAIDTAGTQKQREVTRLMFEDLLHPLSQGEVARRLGVTQQNIGQLRSKAIGEIVRKHPEFKEYFETVINLQKSHEGKKKS